VACQGCAKRYNYEVLQGTQGTTTELFCDEAQGAYGSLRHCLAYPGSFHKKGGWGWGCDGPMEVQ
jgi:hypothetical protein